MKLSQDEVQHIASLAQLDLSPDEQRLYGEQLSAILAHFEKLQELDTEEIPPTATVFPLYSVMRDDVARLLEEGTRRAILANAPDAEDGCFRVPAILE